MNAVYASAMEELKQINKRRGDEEARLDYLNALAIAGAVMEFFGNHQDILAVRLGGDWEYDDEGGTRFYLSVSIHDYVEGTKEPVDDWEREDDLRDAIDDADFRRHDHTLSEGHVISRADLAAHPDPESLARHLGLIR